MKSKAVIAGKLFRPAFGAVLATLCGLLLLQTPLGAPWVNASYDYLFRFSSRPAANRVVLIRMDNDAYDYFHQVRGQPWDRALHAELLNRLADDGCALVVFDSFFRSPRDPASDAALAEAMRRQKVVLMAGQAELIHPTLAAARPTLPTEPFLGAAGTNWGVAWLDPDLDRIVRRHWPFSAPGPSYSSLALAAARSVGRSLGDAPEDRWLRYYGQEGSWTCLSYRFALTQPTNFFRGRVVFIGTQPATSVAGDEKDDEFRTPYTRWTGESAGGVEIMITSFLNLLHGDWLRRPAGWMETLAVVTAGIILGLGLGGRRPVAAGAWAGGIALAVAFAAISWSHFTNYWFPWLVIAGGQAPCALAWAVATQKSRAPGMALEPVRAPQRPPSVEVEVHPCPAGELPEVPDYELMQPPFGRGSYGKVWLVRNAVGQWQALKAVYLASFGQDPDPYEREFNGIKRYKPISDQHPGLLRVDFVSKKKEAGYFYYVMELGDPLEPGWEQEPSTYRPRDLVSERRRSHGQKLSARECLRIGIALADALDFLHRQGLTHRDIKPQNIIFVNGQPKLADVGLIAEIRPPDRVGTLVGTPGYMPPPPESPGTPQADIYALGMVLYVLSTGRGPAFPEISTTLVNHDDLKDFFPLNAVLLKACHPDRAERYAAAADMCLALREAQQLLETRITEQQPHRTG